MLFSAGKRGTWFLGGALALSVIAIMAAPSHAAGVAVPSTPQQAGQMFGSLLTTLGKSDSSITASVVSAGDYRVLGPSGVDALIEDLKKLSVQLRFNASPTRQEDGASVVEISPDSSTFTLPIVTVTEQSGFRVDLLATYRKTLKLEEGAFQKRVFALTDVMLTGLPIADETGVHNRVCRKNLIDLQAALAKYLIDHNNTFPLAEKWTEALGPYVPNKEIFNCPDAPGGKWGYAFNLNLSGQPYSKIVKPELTQAFYESTTLTADVAGTGTDMAFRHKATKEGDLAAYAVAANGNFSATYAAKTLEFGLKPHLKMRH